MKTKNKLKEILSNFWKGIVGLEPDQSIKTLSETELYGFYRDLGYQPFAMVLFFASILWFLSMNVSSGKFDMLFVVSFGVVVFSFILKLLWPKRRKVIKREQEDVDAEFNQVGFKGFLTYDGRDYVVEDYSLSGKNLSNLSFLLEFDKEKGRVVKIVYLKDERKFVKITDVVVTSGLNKSYRVISWIFFIISIISTFVMIVGTLVIAF